MMMQIKIDVEMGMVALLNAEEAWIQVVLRLQSRPSGEDTCQLNLWMEGEDQLEAARRS